jgi:hypothetical protein
MSKFGIFDANGVPVTTDAYDEPGMAETVITGAGKQGVWFARSLDAVSAVPPPIIEATAVGVSVTPTPSATSNVSGTPVSPMPQTATPIEVVELPVPPALAQLFPFDAHAELPSAAPSALHLGQGSEHDPPVKVALLHSGGAGSTAMLLHLLSRGYEVHPYFVRCFKHKALNDHGQAMAERSVRRLRDWGNNVARLTTIEVTDKRQRVAAITGAALSTLLERLRDEAQGEGFNLLVLGEYDSPADSETEDDEGVETLAQRELIQVCSWADYTETGTLEEILTLVDDGAGPFRQLLWDASTSCTQVDAEVGLDCGECAHCNQRANSFIDAWGEDRTKYPKKTIVRRIAKHSRLGEGQDVALVGSLLLEAKIEPELAQQFPLLVTKVRSDGLYEVGMMRGGKLAAVGAFCRTSLEKK